MSDDREYHIGIAPGEIPELVLLPGDPDRAHNIAMKFFEEPEEIAKKRAEDYRIGSPPGDSY